ncbi:leucine-rich repeat-containing protein 16C isoform C [Alligator mississippiensis]|uniref:Leucine-rich repeat-containing protein 16C isoform C n=1 Tax=Alligator mississippiensis TaxID=8496 RepID=A0A151NJN6_ALLMI|nr:leucine-rich repeat-containing protein 16C isoform C [Alligator mississippiensis]
MAVSLGGIPSEVQESITAFLGTKEVVLVKSVQLQIKSKYEDYIMVLTPWRAYVLQVILPIRVQSSFSFLEVREIVVREPSLVVIETDTSSYAFRLMSFDDLEQIVIHVTMSLKKVFPDSSPGKLLKNSPPNLYERIRKTTESLEEMLQNNQGPCGGFSETYAALCDYNGFAFREEIQWDVDNIYNSQDCREFNLLDFSHLESRDVALSVAALSFNLWFTKLYCKDFRLNLEISEQLLYMLSKSMTLEELVLENSGLKYEFAQRMAQALSRHPDSALSTISLAGNQLEDRDGQCLLISDNVPRIIAFSRHLEKRSKGLQSLNFSRTSLTAKGMNTLCQSLAANGVFSTSLYHLDLSGNPGILATEDASSLHSFLSCSNSLSHLNLSGTDCALDALLAALAEGCRANLVHLDLSKNIYSHKRVKDVTPAIKQFFSNASVLKYVSLAGTKLPPDVLRALLQGLAYNSQISDLHLDLSNCELRSAGAQVIQDLIFDANSISDLDLSDNGFDSDMVTLVLSIGRSKSIRHVSLGKNFSIKSKDSLADVLHRIVQLTQEDDCPLQSLSVADSRLKSGTNVLLSALGSNTSLTKLDISGNTMGDTGARMLAKALQINTKLRTVIWDRNNTTANGFLDVAHALERNYTLKSMPLPMSDVMQAYRNNPEKTEEAVHKIQSCLMRNQMRRALPKQTFRLQQGIVTSSSEQMVNELCLSVQKHIDVLNSCLGREVEADILCAEESIKNANHSISILPLLYEAGDAPYQNGKLQHKLESLTEEALQACSREIQVLMQATLDTTQNLCPKILQKSGIRDQLINAMSERVILQDHLNLSVILDQLVTDVFNKLNEIKLSVTAAVADRIIDEVLEDLTIAQCKLAESLPRHSQDLQLLQTDIMEEDNVLLMKSRNLLELAEKGFAVEECKMALRRKNKHFRSIRPTPAMRSLSELNLQAEAEDNETGTHQALLSVSCASVKSRPASTKDAEAGSSLLPCTELASTQSLMDLPTEGEKLEHYTRTRPRPNRRNKQPPSKPNVQPVSCDNDEDRSITRVDEGLDEFFTKKLIQEELPRAALEICPDSAPLTSSGSRTFKKKIGNFFAFKKPKSTRVSKCEKEPEGSPVAAKGRKSMLSDILRSSSKAGEAAKPLSKSEEGGLAVEPRADTEHSQTPDAARRIRPKYSREGKSQSLILLSGEDEEVLGVKHEKKRHFEKSDGEIPNSFEQRVHVMLHRIGVTKVLSSEGKKKQNKDGEIKKAGSDGDIVDSSADSPPPSLKSRTHSVSTDASLRSRPADTLGRAAVVEQGSVPSETRLTWKALGKQLNAELKGKCSELHSPSRRPFVIQEQSSPTEKQSRETWSSSLPRTGRSPPVPSPRRISNSGDARATSELLSSPAAVDTIAEDNQLKLKPPLKNMANRRAISVHEEQLRDQDCMAELENVTIPLRLRRSPVFKRRNKPEATADTETNSELASQPEPQSTLKQEPHGARGPMEELHLKPGAETAKDLLQVMEETIENAHNIAIDQRTAALGSKAPTQGQ